MKKIILIVSCLILVLISCQKVPDAGATSAVKVANEWWITLDSVGIPDYYGIGHVKIATYNTTANDNMIWVDDYNNIFAVSGFLPFDFKVKAVADYSTLTFTSDALAANIYYDPTDTSAFPKTVHISEGKIFPKLGHSKSGNIADSIHLHIEFSNDPGTMYEINGIERTMFPQDDY